MQPYPRAPDLVWPGQLLGTGCLSARAMDTGFPTVVWRLCLGVGCAWARVSAAPRHSWLGCWGVCALVCALRLYPATPGWGARCGCVCLGSGFGCAPPLLAGVLGCVCAGVRAPLVPRHSWLGCAVWVCVLGLGFRLRPASPGWGVGVCVCSCARSACTPPLLAGVCGVGVCAWARVSAAPRHSWLGCWGVCAFLCALRLYPATLGWGVRRGCVCLGSGFGCAPPLLAGVLGCVCVRVRAPLVPRHSWLGCAALVCVLGLGFRLRPATPGWGVGVCVCSCARSACTPSLLAGVCGVGVCAWARVSAAPRHSWLGCWGVCLFVCALRLYPATPGWGVRRGCVCLGSGFGCAPPLLAGVLGCVCACVRAPLVPRHSWLGCAAWACVLGLGFRLRPASPGWGVGVRVFVCALRLYPATPAWGVRRGCVCVGSGFGCAPPLLAGVLGCVCVCVRAPLVPRHSWLGCAVWVGALGLRLRLRCATPGWGVQVCVCALRLYPATPGWGVLCGCVCLGSGFGCAPPLLAWVLGCVCVRVRAPLVPRHSCLGCAVRVCVRGLGFRLCPATPGSGVGVCVCSCARSACTPPLLAGVCGVGVCAWARVSAAPRHSWLGCWGVCLLVCALRLYPATLAGVCGVWVGCCLAPVPVPWFVACCARRPGLRHPVAVVAWHLSVCLGCGRRRASLACLVAPRWCAAPRPVRSLSVLRSAFPTPWCLSPSRGLAPPDLLGGCAGHVEAGREPGSLCLPLAPAEAGAPGSLHVVPVQGPAMGLSLAGPSGVGLGLRALRWFACVDPVTDASGFPYRPSSDGGLGRCTGAVSCGRRHRHFRVGGRHARVPCVCACARPSWPGRAGRPPGRVLVRSLFVRPPPGWGCPVCGCCWVFLFFFFPVAPPLSPAFPVFRPGVPWALASCGPPACPPPCLLFFLRPLVSGVPWFPARGALGLGALWSSPLAPLFVFFFRPLPPPPFFFACGAPVFCLFPLFFFFFRRCLFFFCLGVFLSVLNRINLFWG